MNLKWDIIKIYKEKIISDVKLVIRLMISIGLYYSWIINLFRFVNRRLQKDGAIMILAYHNIGNGKYLNLDIPEGVFKKQIEFLVQHNYNIISLDEAVKLLRAKVPIPKDTIVLTFDDGYKSMYTSVFPLIKKYGVPITIFPSVGTIMNQFPLFVDALVYAVDKSFKKDLDLFSFGLKKFSIKSKLLKENAIYEINEYSKTMKNEEKDRLLEYIFKQLGVDVTCQDLRETMLSWDEIKEMKRYGVSFGAHTVSHPVLSKIPIKDAMDEVSNSKKIIQEKLGEDVRHFAYPYGTKDSFNQETARAVEQSGLTCACTLTRGGNEKGCSLFYLRRNMVVNGIPNKSLMVFSKAVFAIQITRIFDIFLLRPLWRRIGYSKGK